MSGKQSTPAPETVTVRKNDFVLKTRKVSPVPKLAPPKPPNQGGGGRIKKGAHKYSVRSTIYSTYDKGALNRPIVRFNIFFV